MALSSFIAFSFLKPYPNSPPSLFRFPALNSERCHGRRQSQLSSCSNWNPTPEPEKPVIQLEFIGPRAEAAGSHPAESAIANSGEKLLRNIMLENKIELYAAYGKLMNCGGGGSCGTCIVEAQPCRVRRGAKGAGGEESTSTRLPCGDDPLAPNQISA